MPRRSASESMIKCPTLEDEKTSRGGFETVGFRLTCVLSLEEANCRDRREGGGEGSSSNGHDQKCFR